MPRGLPRGMPRGLPRGLPPQRCLSRRRYRSSSPPLHFSIGCSRSKRRSEEPPPAAHLSRARDGRGPTREERTRGRTDCTATQLPAWRTGGLGHRPRPVGLPGCWLLLPGAAVNLEPGWQPDRRNARRRRAHLALVRAGLATIPALRARLAAQEIAAVDMDRAPNHEELAEVARVTRVLASGRGTPAEVDDQLEQLANTGELR